MTTPAPNPALDAVALLRDLQWVRGLAAGLVRDANEADELVQETCVRALEHPPGAPGGRRAAPRVWLAAVMRNVLRERARRGSRRGRRERAAARPERVPAADELAAEVELQRRIAAEVLALREPLRETVLLRFVHDLEPTAIGRRLGVPPGTVRSRLKRGLDELRERLDRAHGGDRAAWAGAAVSWVTSEGEAAGATAAAATGGTTMATTGTIGWTAAAALAAATVAGAVWSVRDGGDGAHGAAVAALDSGRDPGTDSPAHSSAGDATASGVAGTANSAPGAPIAARTPARAPAAGSAAGNSAPGDAGEESAPGAAALADVVAVGGRVVDDAGTPLAGIPVYVGAAEDPFSADSDLPTGAVDDTHGRTVETAADGTFRAVLARPGPVEVRVARPPARYRHSHRARHPHPAAVLHHAVDAPAEGLELVLVENPVATLTVRVHDAATDRFLDAFRFAYRGEGMYSIQSVDGDRFEAEVPLLAEAPETITVSLVEPRHEPRNEREVLLRPGETTDVVFALQSDHVLRGRVTDAQDNPLQHAAVFFGSIEEVLGDEPRESFALPSGRDWARTDADGRFELAGSGPTVGVFHAGHASATVPVEDAWNVVLGPRGALELRGAPDGPVGVGDRDEVGTVVGGSLRLEDLDPRTHWIHLADGTALSARIRGGETTARDLRDRIARVVLEVRAGGVALSGAGELEGILVGAGAATDTPGAGDVATVHELEGAPPIDLAGVLPGRYHAFLRDGRQGRAEIAGGRAVLELGATPVVLRASVPRARVAITPAGADGWLALLPRRAPARADDEGVVRHPHLPAGTWTATDLLTGASATFVVGTEPVDVDLR